jgi:hypothetical protein
VALAVTQAPWGFASQFVGAATGLASYVGNMQARKRQAAFAFVTARRPLAWRTRHNLRAAARG